MDSYTDEYHTYEDGRRLVPYYNMAINMLQDQTRNQDLAICKTDKLGKANSSSINVETYTPRRVNKESTYDYEPFEDLC